MLLAGHDMRLIKVLFFFLFFFYYSDSSFVLQDLEDRISEATENEV